MSEMVFVEDMPNGFGLWRQLTEAGGWAYYSNESGIQTLVWDSTVVDRSTVERALLDSKAIQSSSGSM